MVTTNDILQTTAGNITIDPTITISGEASLNEIYGSPGQFVNQGTIEDNKSGSILYAQDDPFTNYSGGTLTGGTWEVSGGGDIRLMGDVITTNAATISLSGAASQIYSDYGYTPALADLATNTSNGNLLLAEGYAFSTSVFALNAGSIAVSSGASATLQGTAWNNSGAGTITVTDATLNLFGSWANHGAIAANASTVSLGNPVNISPTAGSAPGYSWSSPGTIVFSGGCIVNLGGVFTTDTFDGIVADQQPGSQGLANETVNLTGTLDNSTADNLVSGGVLAIGGLTGAFIISGGRVYQGDVTTAGGDDLVATPVGGTLDGVQLGGTLDMTQFSDATARVIDSLTLDGTIDLGGAAGTTNNATLYVGNGSSDTNPETIGGSGVLQFGQDNSGDTLENVSSAPMTFGPGLTIQGGLISTIDSPNAAIDNEGAIEEATSGGMLTVDGLSGLSNAGSVIVSGGGSLSTGNADETQSGGTTTVDGTLSAANMNLDGGILNGTGTVQANVINAATVYPGDPPGPLTVQGNFTQDSSGVLDIVLGGPNVFSQLAISGSAALDGTLNVTVTNGYTPNIGDTFQILTSASQSGSFATQTPISLGNGNLLKPIFNSGLITLANNPGTAADFVVNAATADTAGSSLSVTVTAQDYNGNTATGYTGTVQLTSSDSNALLPANATLTAGVGVFSVTLTTAGTQTITATDTVTGTLIGTGASITVSPAAANHFAISAPSNVAQAAPFTFTVTAEDPFDNPANYAATLGFTSTDRSAGLPANATLTGGTGTFGATLNTLGSQTISVFDAAVITVYGRTTAITVSASRDPLRD